MVQFLLGLAIFPIVIDVSRNGSMDLYRTYKIVKNHVWNIPFPRLLISCICQSRARYLISLTFPFNLVDEN